MAEFDEEAVRRDVEKTFGHKAAQGQQRYQPNSNSSIEHVIGVVSGKGGVGKSLVTSALACSLRRQNRAVGILDADFTGASIPRILGLSGARAAANNGNLVPAVSKGSIKVMSTNLILEHEDDPVLWRGPILMGALRQFFEETDWGKLDYLLTDMPPGTGDVALSVFQSLPLDGIIIVTSPQDLVRMVVGKAVKMAEMMSIPIIGVIENMSYVTCPDCGRKIEIYGKSHLEEACKEFGLTALDHLPIDPALAAACDDGSFEDVLPGGFISKATSAITHTCES